MTRKTFECVVLGELVDRSGEVLYANYGKNQITDDVTKGITFSEDNRKEIVIKNALLDLAKKFDAEVKFKRLELPITAVAKDGVQIEDKIGVLAPGENVQAFTRLGKIPGIQEDVVVPTWGLLVNEANNGKAQAGLDLPLVDKLPALAPKDLVIIETTSGPANITLHRFGACGTHEKLGALALPGFEDMAQNIFAHDFAAPYFARNFAADLNQVVSADAGFKKGLKLSDPKLDYCVEPVYRIDPASKKCEEDNTSCQETLKVRVTYRVKQANEIKARSGLEVSMTASAIPQGVPDAVRLKSLESDLVDEVLKLSKTVVKEISKQKF
jgi:hypothetical protein